MNCDTTENIVLKYQSNSMSSLGRNEHKLEMEKFAFEANGMTLQSLKHRFDGIEDFDGASRIHPSPVPFKA